MFSRIVFALGLLAISTEGYVWPSRYDGLEDILAIHSGYIRFGFSDLVVPCGFGSGMPGVQNAAEWIRSAFHDMATFNASTGTGGLDASLLFELDRPENLGSAFNNTFAAMWDFLTPRSSVSDLLALSVVVSSASCRGPRIPFRAGRVDATEAGPAGVPKPEDDLESTRRAFQNAGFSNDDMITMVACGHSLGNIHSVDFPDMVDGTASAENIAHFDTTPTNFDNNVVTEYLDSSTSNPLVMGTNETTNSDKRIFSSDGNATMSSLADPATFQANCRSIFERMINTVPATVTLSEPIEIIDVKPYVNQLSLQTDGSLLFEGRIRVRTNPEEKVDGDDLEVSLSYTDRHASNSTGTIVASRARARGGQSYGFWGNTFTWFEFSESLNASTGISAFNIHLKTPSTGDLKILNNGNTGGYPVNSDLLYQQTESCMTGSGDTRNLVLTAAVRGEVASQSSPPMLKLAQKISRQGIMLPKLEIQSVPFRKLEGSETNGFQYFQADAEIEASGWSTTFDITLESPSTEQAIEISSLKTDSLSGTCGST